MYAQSDSIYVCIHIAKLIYFYCVTHKLITNYNIISTYITFNLVVHRTGIILVYIYN